MEFFWIIVFICIIGAGISLFKKQPNSSESVAEPVPLNQENIDNLDTLIRSASSDTTKLILQNMTEEDAKFMEVEKARRLCKRGYGVWQK